MKKALLLFFILVSSLSVAQTENYVVENLKVNTKNNEFGSTITSGGDMLYAKTKNTKSIRSAEAYAKLFKGRITGKGKFEKGSKFKENAINVAFSKNGETVYYSKIVSGKFQLFRVDISTNGEWKSSVRLPFNLPNYNFKQPALSVDSSLLFFVSDMPSSYGETDIYYVSIERNPEYLYGVPVNLGESVNSMGVELYPFVDANDKLFFSSTDTSMGGLDIFESASFDGLYAEKTPLRAPINSVADDFGLIISASAETGYFTSNRKGGKGGYDIYSFKEVALPEGACSGYIRGFIKNKESLNPVTEATVECFDPSGNATSVLTDSQGKFVIYNIDCKIRYDIVSYKEGYSFAEVQTVATKGSDLTLYLESDNQEEFEEEINLNEETTIIDTETNQVVETVPLDIEETEVVTNNYVEKAVVPERKLSFAEKRELDRLKKEREKKERIAREIAEEKEALRIKKEKEAARKKAILLAEQEKQKREKEEQVARAKERAEELKSERERVVAERKAQIAATKVEAEKARVEEAEKEEVQLAERKRAVVARRAAEKKKQVEARERQIAEAKQRAERIRVAQEKQKEDERLKQEQIAKEVAEAKKIEAERKAELLAQKQAIEKERQIQIAEAKARAEAIRIEQAETQRVLQEQKEQERITAENAIIAQQAEEKKLREQEAKERAEAIRIAQEAKAESAQAAAVQVAEAESVTKRLEQEAQDRDEEKRILLQEQRNRDLAEAKARAKALREEQRKAQEEIAARKERERISEEEEILARQNEERRIREEEAQRRADEIRIAAQEQADRNRKEVIRLAEEKAEEERVKQEVADREEAQRKSIENQRQKDIAEAKAKAEAIRVEQLVLEREKAEEQEIKRAAAEQAVALQQAEQKRIRQEEANARAEKIRLAEEEKMRAAEAQEQREAQEVAAQEERKAEAEKQARLQEELIRQEQEKEIASAKARAEVIRKEQEKVQRELAITRAAEETRRAAEEVELERKRLDANEQEPIASTDAESRESTKDETPGKCTRNISGFIKNPVNNKGIANATVDMYFEGQNIESTLSDANGAFYFQDADCNTTYTIVSYKPEIDDFAKLPVDTDKLIVGITLFLHNEEEITAEQEEKPTNQFVNPEEPVVIENEIEESEVNEEEAITTERESEAEAIQTEPEEVVEAPKIVNGKVDLNPIYFDLDEYYLTLSARRELDKIIVLMVQRPTMIIESGSHTDTRGPFDYNLELSEKRSQQTVGYLIANGVDPDRISGRGYGESMPLNHCVEGIRCSEREHLVNRRTEFRILRD